MVTLDRIRTDMSTLLQVDRNLHFVEVNADTIDEALADAVVQGLKEQGLDKDFELKAVSCNGIEECRKALLQKSKNLIDVNFIEGMACVGGCIGGAGCLTHGPKDKREVDKYGMEAFEKTITDSISIYNIGE